MFDRHEVVVGGRRLAYWEQNPQSTKVIMLVHGFRGEHSGLADLTAPYIDYRVIMPDLPGFGESEPLLESHSIEHYAAVLEHLMVLLDVPRFSMVGHSYGGTIALAYAGLYGSRLQSLGLAMPALPNLISQRLVSLELGIGDSLPTWWQSIWFNVPIKDAIGYLSMTRSPDYGQRLTVFWSKLWSADQVLPRVAHETLHSFITFDAWQYAAKIRVPTIIVGGQSDFIASQSSLEDLSHRVEGACLIVIPGAGHVLNLDRPALLGSVLYQFLSQVGGARPADTQLYQSLTKRPDRLTEGVMSK